MSKSIEDPSIRWGVIGVGDVCEVKSAPAMQLIPNSSLVAVMRRNAEKAEDYARRHNVPSWYSDAEALLDDEEVNAIYIATPPGSHAYYTKMAAERGLPIYVEKPMAINVQECREMLEICEQNQVPLHVAYYRRTLPNFLKIKELIDDGKIGSPRVVHIKLIQTAIPAVVADLEHNWRVKPEVAGGGYFYDLASHQLDFLDYLFGPITEASGRARNQAGLYPAEDIVVGEFEFSNGVLGSGLWCFSAHETAEEEMTTIVGSNGTIQYQNFGDNRVVLRNDDGEQVFEFDMPKHIQQPLIQAVVDSLLGKGDSPSTGISAARTNWVMEKMVSGNQPN